MQNTDRDFSVYEAMETEELKALLRQDCQKEKSDTQLALFIMEELAKQEAKDSQSAAAWETFQANYLPEVEENKKKHHRFVRRMVAAAAVVALAVCIPITTRSFGVHNTLRAVANWTKNTFSFVTGQETEPTDPQPSDARQYNTLQEAIRELERDDVFGPTWFPEGYVLVDIKITDTPQKKEIDAAYENGTEHIFIDITHYLPYDSIHYEVEGDPIEIYESDGVEYYFFENLDHLLIVWRTETCECSISGKITIEEAKMMIDSIGK